MYTTVTEIPTEVSEETLQLGFGRGTPPPKTPAWKQRLGDNPASARFELLPETKPRWSALGASFLFQCAFAAFLFSLPMFFPEQLIPRMVYEVIPLAMPPTTVPVRPKPPVQHVKVQPPPPEIKPRPDVAKLMAPKLIAPRLQPKRMPPAEVPKVNEAFQQAKIDAPDMQPARPRPPVQTGVLSTGSAAVPTINQPIEKVQTGGFGDPNGLPGSGNPNKRANIARYGSFDLPDGPGYGNGTGGAHGARGAVASAAQSRGAVQSAGFAAATMGSDAPKAKTVEASSPTVEPVVILDKPKPAYTAEARRLGIEGEVLLDVVFPASGPVRVLRLLQGLGHGLDETAIRAAQQIRFKPALRNGQPVDFPATVHIVFQIAN